MGTKRLHMTHRVFGKWNRVLWIAGVIACGCAAATAATPSPWIRLEASGVTIFSNASAKDATAFTTGYLAYRHAVRQLIAPPNRELGPINVILFQTRQELGQIRHDTIRTDLALTTELDGDAIIAVAVEGNRQQALQIAFEFDTMRSLSQMGYFFPLWMGRGIAAAMSTVRVNDTSCIVGDPLDSMATELKKRSWLPWSEVSAMRPNSPAYGSSETFGIFAAQSWALVRAAMITEPDKARSHFQALAAEVRSTRQAEMAVAKVLGLAPEKLLSGLKEQAGRKGPVVLPYDAVAAKNSVRVSPVEDWEVALFKAKLMQGFSRHDAAESELAKAVAKAPRHPDVLAAMGRQKMARKESREAIEYYREAIAAGASNPKLLLASATARIDTTKTTGDRPGEGGIAATEAIEEIRQAIALTPGDGEAYQLLGRALFIRAELAAADLEELTPGLASFQHGHWVRSYRALLEQRLLLHDASVMDLKIILTDTSIPGADRKLILENFSKLRAHTVGKQAESLVRAGKYKEAQALIDDLLNPAYWAMLTEEHQSLRDWVGAAETLDGMNQLLRDGRAKELRAAKEAFVAKYPRHPATKQFSAELGTRVP